MKRPLEMKTIGILGGMTDQATAEYYRLINDGINTALGGYETAEIVIMSVNFGNIEWFVRNDEWDRAREYLFAKSQSAKAAGADVLLCSSNTMHKVMGGIEDDIGIPFIHIADPVIAALMAQRITKVGLLGTMPVMCEEFMTAKYRASGIDVLVPAKNQMVELDRILFDETSKGIASESAKSFFYDVVKSLVADGAEGIILGCTELFLLIDPSAKQLAPLFDTTRLHVDAVVKTAMK